MARLTIGRVRDGLTRRARPHLDRAHRILLRRPDRVTCPVCGWSGVQFRASSKPRRPNRICPSCSSSERYRALELHLRRLGPVAAGTRLLEVAPIDTVRRTAESLGYEYQSIDLHSPRATVRGDLCAIPFEDGAFDMVVCFHVLEHIPADVTAVAELARVTRPGGSVLAVVPRDRNRSVTFEVPDADPADYERLYGQSDHVRIYGADVVDRWLEAPIEVEEVPWTDHFTAEEHRRAALSGSDDRFWVIRASA